MRVASFNTPGGGKPKGIRQEATGSRGPAPVHEPRFTLGNGKTLQMDGLDAARRQADGLSETAHRPWPPPRSPWVMGQSWLELAFLHWPVDADALRSHLPAGL